MGCGEEDIVVREDDGGEEADGQDDGRDALRRLAEEDAQHEPAVTVVGAVDLPSLVVKARLADRVELGKEDGLLGDLLREVQRPRRGGVVARLRLRQEPRQPRALGLLREVIEHAGKRPAGTRSAGPGTMAPGSKNPAVCW